jgi:hypothetical protein
VVDVRQHTVGIDTIYSMVMKEARWGAVSPGSGWSIPLFRAAFPRFGSKTVEYSRYLPSVDAGDVFAPVRPGFYHRIGVRSGAGLWPAGLQGVTGGFAH